MNKTYTEKFKEAYNNRIERQKEYIENNNLMGKSISSLEHPKYFEIDKIWDEKRTKLDAPLLKLAYYKVGDIVCFVKKNTYADFETINKKPHLLKMKGYISYVIFDKDDEEICIDNPIKNNIFYENILTLGVIENIKTSDCGSGEILYELKDVIPAPPESNPYVMEKDIITINDFNFFNERSQKNI